MIKSLLIIHLFLERIILAIESGGSGGSGGYTGGTSGGSGGGKPHFPTLNGLPITSRYGYRGDIGIPGASKYHWAIDIGSGGIYDPPIFATQSAVVVDKFYTASSGHALILKHTGDSYYSRYLHMKEESSLSVGDEVNKGDTIGIMGSTGISSAAHLDFAISINGSFGIEQFTIDPEEYLQTDFGESGSVIDNNNILNRILTAIKSFTTTNRRLNARSYL